MRSNGFCNWGSQGIGRTICHRFAELGAMVWAADIEEQLLSEITDGLDDKVMPRIKTVHSRCHKPKKSPRYCWLCSKSTSTTGAIDVLIHSAGGVSQDLKHPSKMYLMPIGTLFRR